MGIELFFRALEKNNIANLNNKFVHEFNIGLECTHLFVDFNSIIYTVYNEIILNLNNILWNLIINKPLDKLDNYNIPTNISPQEFSQLGKQNMTSIILDQTKQYIIDFLKGFVIPDKLKLIYFAVDGVPTKAKIIEQRNRRYGAYILSQCNKLIFKAYSHTLESDRLLYETLKISWNRNQITPGTEFMQSLTSIFTNAQFIKDICPNLETYIFSGPNVIEEGEKKIINYIRSSPYQSGKYVVFSGDTDMVLLCMLLNTELNPTNPHKISELKMIKHNQQKNNYDIIDISKLKNNLCDYVKSSVNLIDSFIIDDIVFLLTIFGNDFLPKIGSYSARYDFTNIINYYTSVMKNTNIHIISWNDQTQKKQLNQSTLLEILKILKDNETDIVRQNYMASKYKNYRQLKQKFPNLLQQENITFIPIQHFKSIKLFPFMNVTKYDEELYDFEHKNGKYKQYLNANGPELGKVKSINGKLKVYNMKKSIQRYYDYFFENTDLQSVLANYTEGLIWLFEYYYNDFGSNYANNWYYKYTTSPLVRDIYKYLKKHKLSKIDMNIYKIPTQQHFNLIELLMYVSPCYNMLYMIPNEYHDFIKQYYVDLDPIAGEIINGTGQKYINCSGHTFLSKCHFHINHKFSDDEFFTLVRNIPIPESLKTNFSPKDDYVCIFQNHHKEKYKKQYQETGNYTYKQLYKMIKHNQIFII